jgi:hypothetical protein
VWGARCTCGLGSAPPMWAAQALRATSTSLSFVTTEPVERNELLLRSIVARLSRQKALSELKLDFRLSSSNTLLAVYDKSNTVKAGTIYLSSD